MAVALILAAGRGERLGFGRPKALVPLRGRPMLEYSVRALSAVDAVTRIVLALPLDALHAAPDGVVVVAGGRERSHSVLAALEASEAEDPVIVHDAARPLAPAALFAEALAALERRPHVDAVVAAAPVSDTIKEISAADGATVTATLDRSRLWAVQTPQVFRRAVLERVLRTADKALLARATDDAWLVERAGGVVQVLASDPGNLKVTTPHDLRVAELVLAEREVASLSTGTGGDGGGRLR